MRSRGSCAVIRDPSRRWRLGILGLGNVGGGFISILQSSATKLAKRYGVEFAVTAVAELGGGAVDPGGLDLSAVLAAIDAGEPVATLHEVGRRDFGALDLLDTMPDLIIEATPVDLANGGEPALSTVVRALGNGIHVVMANKGPLALAYRQLRRMSTLPYGRNDPAGSSPQLRFSACVGGALPVVNIGLRDLAGCRITRFEGVLNGTSQSILRTMESGRSYGEALADAQRRGIAEADPALDVNGWDAACKLVIAANAVLDADVELRDVHVDGITGISPGELRAAARTGRRIVPLCSAELVKGTYRLAVQPTPLALDHPLARLTPDEMGAVYYTNTVDRLAFSSSEATAVPSAAAMLRDLLDVCSQISESRR